MCVCSGPNTPGILRYRPRETVRVFGNVLFQMEKKSPHGIPPPPFFRAHFPPEIAKDARNFETALLCFICINQKPKDFDPPIERPQTTKRAGVAEIAGEKGEEGRRRQHLPVNDGRCHRPSTHSPAILGPVTHVCPPFPQVSCRGQRDLFGGLGRPRTFLRTTSTTWRGGFRMRHSGSNRHPCVCHASRHPTGRHPSGPSLTHLGWVPHA